MIQKYLRGYIQTKKVSVEYERAKLDRILHENDKLFGAYRHAIIVELQIKMARKWRDVLRKRRLEKER